MKRVIRAIGLGCIAALALSASISASASAQFPSITAPKSPVWLTGTSSDFQLTAGNNAIECTHTTFKSWGLSTPVREFSLTPSFSGCTAFGVSTTHVIDKECEFDLELTTGHAGGQFPAGVSLYCLGHLVVTPTLFGFSVCSMTLGMQGPKGHFTVTNLGGSPSRLQIGGSISEVEYSSSGGACGSAGNHKDGEIHLGATVVRVYEGINHTVEIGGVVKTP